MGLDMYLRADKYISSYDEQDKRISAAVKVLLGLPFELKGVTVDLAYWRKSNQIHRWFVQNVQDGVDECQRADVSKEQLKELLDVCKKVLADHTLAETLLPTESGFFFGGTEYNEHYFSDLQDTVDNLEKVLAADLTQYDIYYRSSW